MMGQGERNAETGTWPALTAKTYAPGNSKKNQAIRPSNPPGRIAKTMVAAIPKSATAPMPEYFQSDRFIGPIYPHDLLIAVTR